jgi:S1-C subfamily serine protease
MRVVITLILFMAATITQAAFNPKTNADFYDTSVRVYNLEMNSGGTGSIFRSYKNASHILTNKHVCALIKPGGYVNYKNKDYIITHYKEYKRHDLCLVRINKGLKISLNISQTISKVSQTVYVSGHPNLLPHIVTKGHISDNMDIQIITGNRPCNKKEIIEDPARCSFFGGMPIIEVSESTVVSNLIKPGSSGSAVFNSAGELVGVVYAGSGRGFSHGFIVPHIYLLYFVQNAHRQSWVRVGLKSKTKGSNSSIFNYENCTGIITKPIKTICDSIQDNLIWRK